MFDYFKKKAIENRANDEILYEYVTEELEQNIKVKGLWAKAYANSDGNDNKIEPLYMQYRVQAIKDVFSSLEIMYNELSRQKLFDFISNGFKSENIAEIQVSNKELLERKYSINKKEKEFMEKYGCNVESNNVKITLNEITITTDSGQKRYIR